MPRIFILAFDSQKCIAYLIFCNPMYPCKLCPLGCLRGVWLLWELIVSDLTPRLKLTFERECVYCRLASGLSMEYTETARSPANLELPLELQSGAFETSKFTSDHFKNRAWMWVSMYVEWWMVCQRRSTLMTGWTQSRYWVSLLSILGLISVTSWVATRCTPATFNARSQHIAVWSLLISMFHNAI